MSPGDPLFACFATAVCQAIVGNIIELRAALLVLEKRGLISGPEIASARTQVPPELSTQSSCSQLRALGASGVAGLSGASQGRPRPMA